MIFGDFIDAYVTPAVVVVAGASVLVLLVLVIVAIVHDFCRPLPPRLADPAEALRPAGSSAIVNVSTQEPPR